jgi:TolA-binding protein
MLFTKKARKLAALKEPVGQMLEMLPSAIVKGDSLEKTLLRAALAQVNPRNIKRLGALLLGGGVAVSLAGSWLRRRSYRAALAKEMKKQLAPLNKKLDELEKQNEELKKQNEELKKKLR